MAVRVIAKPSAGSKPPIISNECISHCGISFIRVSTAETPKYTIENVIGNLISNPVIDGYDMVFERIGLGEAKEEKAE